jgi:hypothetical protein
MAELSKEKLDKFYQAGQRFKAQLDAEQRPEFNSVLQGAVNRGLNMPAAAASEIVELCAPEVIYFLASPENEAEARMLNVAEGEPVNDELAADKIRRIRSRIQRNQTYVTIQAKPDDTEKYLLERRAKIKAGLRRR